MQVISTLHQFTPDPFLKQTARWWAWQCSCGARSPGHYRWKDKARLAWYRTHVHPGAASTEPVHRAIVTGPNEYNTYEWTCSCGDVGRPHGFVSESRAWQSHGRHSVRGALTWYEHLTERLATLAERAESEAQRWDRLSPEGRARLAARELKDLL